MFLINSFIFFYSFERLHSLLAQNSIFDYFTTELTNHTHALTLPCMSSIYMSSCVCSILKKTAIHYKIICRSQMKCIAIPHSSQLISMNSPGDSNMYRQRSHSVLKGQYVTRITKKQLELCQVAFLDRLCVVNDRALHYFFMLSSLTVIAVTVTVRMCFEMPIVGL